MVSTHRYCHAERQRTRGALTGAVQGDPGDVQEPRPTLTGMNTTFDAPADGGYPAGTPDPHSARFRKKWWFRWGTGAALVGFLVGGGITLAAVSGGGTAVAGSASGAQAAALSTALGDAANSAVPPARVRWALGRLRYLGGVDGTATIHNKAWFHTFSFQRGSVQSVSGGNVVVKSAD